MDKEELKTLMEKADQELAKQASEGNLDAIKLLSERMQDREELKLRKELFGV